MSEKLSFELAVQSWAARVLGVAPEDVADTDCEVIDGCGFNTCEYTVVKVTVLLHDGRRFQGQAGFGAFLSDLTEEDLGEVTLQEAGEQ